MRHRNINGFNCPTYHTQPNAQMIVRMPEEHISWQSLNEVDLLDLIKKLLTKKEKQQQQQNNDGGDDDENYQANNIDYFQWIPYNELYQHLIYQFPE